MKRLLSELECRLAQLNEQQLRAALVRYVGCLPTTPGDRERLVADPGLLPTAMEEFLRAYASVTWRGW